MTIINNLLFNLIKEADPDFKKYLEEKLTISRENFNSAFADAYGLGPDTSVSDTLELAETSVRLWRLLRKYHV